MILPSLLFQLINLFHLGFNFITADNIPQPNWRTNRKYPLSTGEFVKLYIDSLYLLGVSFGDRTRYAMIDIDIHSPYHPNNDPQAYARLLFTLEQIELVYPVTIRSSHSGGIHIYYFFPRPVPTFRIAALIRVTLINAKFPIKNGQIEIFPNTKAYSGDKSQPTYYKPHRLPLQPDSGACLLDQWGEELICEANLTPEDQLRLFLAQAKESAQSNELKLIESKFEWAYELFKKHISKYQHYSGSYSEIAQDWKENLELTLDIGWTDYHQTNELLPQFVCYGIVFEGLEDKQQLFDWVHQKVIVTRGYQEYCRHQHEIERKIRDWINSTIDNKYYIKYCGFPPRCGITPHQLVARLNPNTAGINLHNQTIAERTKQRLNDILAALQELPEQIGERIVVIQAKCRELFGESISRNTLYQKVYKAMWAGSKDGEILKNPTPPPIIPQAVVNAEVCPILGELEQEIEIAQIQPEIGLSHTPPLYEAFIAEISSPPDLSLSLAPQVQDSPELPELETSPDSSLEHLSSSLPALVKLEPELDSIPLVADVQSQLDSIDLEHSQSSLPSIDLEHSQLVSDLGSDLIQPQPDLESESDLIQPQLESQLQPVLDLELDLESQIDLDPLHTTRGLRSEPLEQIFSTTNHRDVVEIARDLRANMAAIDDELLREFLAHPQQEAIHQACELASQLVAAPTSELVRAVVVSLSQSQKMDLWRILGSQERAAVEAVMAQSSDSSTVVEAVMAQSSDSSTVVEVVMAQSSDSSTVVEVVMAQSSDSSTVVEAVIMVGTKLRRNAMAIGKQKYPALTNCEVIARNGMDWVVRSACGSSFNVSNHSLESCLWEVEVQEAASDVSSRAIAEIIVGATVRTLTGLLGVVKHVFRSMTPPVVVYHESLGRTIHYSIDDLRLLD